MFPFSITDNTTDQATDYTFPPTFSDGVTYDPVTMMITVPAGVVDFTVTVMSIDDVEIEETETYDLVIDSVQAIGTILDNDMVIDMDTDGDGVLDSVEMANGTNPNDSCDYNVADITEPITSGADCDMDGLLDVEEITGVTIQIHLQILMEIQQIHLMKILMEMV